MFPVHQLPRTPPPGLEPGAAERQSAMLPLHQGGPHSILFVCCRSCCRRSSSDRDSTSGSAFSHVILSELIGLLFASCQEMGLVSISR